ncbi:MAG TPA: LPS assembly lipoprotein LptE [Myxococcota bacterium]|nr:LPS assembly lipoprotein LptE [Myxococcota bacterium]
MQVRVLLAIALLVSGCGYHLAAGDLREVGTIAVVTPRNEAGEPGLDRIVADALRRELLRRSGSRIAESPEKADVVVHGRIVNVETTARSLSSVVLVLEYETHVTLELDAKRGDQVVVAPTRFEDSERHLASGDVEAQRKNREEALRRIASLIAARFMDRLGEQQAAQ